ncbi:dihydrolipoamide acetyltransferase family protein [Peredibacter starrii]|uniref:Dihydrolipoamide acetyltransferase component of pyruvate dehydrogenase complex n=1 Tax=Peredibacter starrii TaxID=28202 RepID=A0AAX4HLI2_9BACT|nr:dihydrolipoamide acetyltransferase family protein [Peredibacter starrii]WPU64071.1 dihydrolipoamide acetyltransferase family protein [Peredibacter starrii]
MAKVEVVMPQMGESITTGTITKWHKNVGEVIELDAILLEISTDKVESEIPSPIHGKIVELLYPEGATVDVGRPIAIIEDDLNAAVSAPSAKPAAAAAPAKAEAAPAQTTAPAAAPVAAPAQVEDEGGFRFYTPLVKAMAKDAGIALSELKNISGSGAGGRVNKSDLEAYIANRGKGGAAVSAPAAKPAAAAPAPTAAPSGVSETRPSGRVEIVAMDNMRKAIAKNMVASKQTSPHVNSIDEIDMTNLVKARNKIKDEFKKREGINLTFSHFVLYAIVQALKEHPLVNASIEGDNIVIKKDIHLGCAVAVPGNGLVVPVIKNAGDLNLTGIARQLDILANKARTKKLTMDDLSGGTYTFTNNGSFGTLIATPVILQPQVGIFCTGVIKKRVMVMEDDAIAIRHMMYGTHTYDHRLIDGELGSKFLASVKHHLETMNPENLI